MVTGPTASGKSAWALDIAQKSGGVILNADSMQVYKDLPILAACPDADELAQAEHRLYGVIDGAELCHVARWMDMAVREIRALRAEGRQVILVGGTGMYIKSLMDGLANLPEVDIDIRRQVRTRLAEIGDEAFHAWLCQLDPIMGQRLFAGDGQRMLRAAEVFLQTGESLAIWQKRPAIAPLPDVNYRLYSIEMPRDILYQRINIRFEKMIERGALDEVATLAKRCLSPELPIMRAHGLPELMAYLRDEMTLEDAILQGQQNSRKYAKRQLTWMRNQFPHAEQIKL